MKGYKRLKSIMYVVILICLLPFLVQCEDSDSDSGPRSYQFPLKAGSSWTYRCCFTVPDSYDHTVIDTLEVMYYLTADTTAVSPDNVESIGILWDDESEQGPYGRDFLANMDDGLHLMGTQVNGGIILQTPSVQRLRAMLFDPQSRSINDWTLEWYDNGETNLLIPYPPVANNEWTFFPGDDWTPSYHMLIGWDTVEVPAGDYSCLHKRIRMPADVGEYNVYDYYYGDPGVVYAYFDMGTQTITNEDGEELGEYDSWMTYELIEYIPGE